MKRSSVVTSLSLISALVLFSIVGHMVSSRLMSVGISQEAVISNVAVVIQDGCLLLFCVGVARELGYRLLFSGSRHGDSAAFRLAFIFSIVGLLFAYGAKALTILIVAKEWPNFAYEFFHLHDYTYVLDMQFGGFVWMAVAQFIVAPLAEEVLFRGLLLRLWATRFGIGWSIALSSLLFTAFHLSKHLYIGTFTFSILACLLYLARKSMAANMLFHSLSNIVAFMLEYVLNFQVAKPRASFTSFYQWWPELLFLTISSPVLFIIIRRYWPRRGLALEEW